MPRIKDTITTADGTCEVSVTVPDGTGPWPGVVMYPDAGGPRATFDEMATRLAGYGYVVLVPDIYYRQAGWAPFDMNTAFSDHAQRNRLFAMMRKVTPEIMAADAAAFFDYLAARPEVRGETFGTTGYCMGGRTSLVVAGRVPERVAVALSFHGGGLASDDPGSPHLLADRMKAVVYVGGATHDASFTKANAKTLDTALTTAGVDHTIEFYAAAHGFAVPDNGSAYDAAAAERHWQVTERVFGEVLASA